MSSPLLLAIETSTNVCSVAVAHGDHVIMETTLRRARAHAEMLVPMMADALRYSGVDRQDLHAVVVSMGPGSYTGLRIGVSTAKGLAVAVETNLIGVPSLDALALSVSDIAAPGDMICATFNSRRSEVYAAVLRPDVQGGLETVRPAAVVRCVDMPAWLASVDTDRLWLVGEGVPRVLPTLQAAGVAVRPLDPGLFAPSAIYVARLGLRRLQAGHLEDVAAFEPAYLKSFVAKKAKSTAFQKLPF